MAFPLLIPAISAGIGAIGNLLGGTKGARTSTSTITPTLAPEYKTLADLLRTRAEDRLRSSVDLSGFTAGGIGNINQAFDAANLNRNNSLTARGLATSPTAGTSDTTFGLARAGNIAEFLNTIPLLQRQMQAEDMSAALPIVNLGRGTTTTGVGPGSTAANAFSTGAELLAYLNGLGVFGGKT